MSRLFSVSFLFRTSVNITVKLAWLGVSQKAGHGSQMDARWCSQKQTSLGRLIRVFSNEDHCQRWSFQEGIKNQADVCLKWNKIVCREQKKPEVKLVLEETFPDTAHLRVQNDTRFANVGIIWDLLGLLARNDFIKISMEQKKSDIKLVLIGTGAWQSQKKAFPVTSPLQFKNATWSVKVERASDCCGLFWSFEYYYLK